MERDEDEREERAEPAPTPASSRRLTDHLANERTLLAWNRTGIATIALGFVVARFGLLIRALGSGVAPARVPSASGFIGIALTLFGALITALSLVRYLQIKRGIERGQPDVEPRLSIILAVGLTVLGLALAGYLAFVP